MKKIGWTQAEAATALGVSRQAIAKRVRRGTLPVLEDGTIDGEAVAGTATDRPSTETSPDGLTLRGLVWGHLFVTYLARMEGNAVHCAQKAAKTIATLAETPDERLGPEAAPFVAALRGRGRRRVGPA